MYISSVIQCIYLWWALLRRENLDYKPRKVINLDASFLFILGFHSTQCLSWRVWTCSSFRPEMSLTSYNVGRDGMSMATCWKRSPAVSLALAEKDGRKTKHASTPSWRNAEAHAQHSALVQSAIQLRYPNRKPRHQLGREGQPRTVIQNPKSASTGMKSAWSIKGTMIIPWGTQTSYLPWQS